MKEEDVLKFIKLKARTEMAFKSFLAMYKSINETERNKIRKKFSEFTYNQEIVNYVTMP